MKTTVKLSSIKIPKSYAVTTPSEQNELKEDQKIIREMDEKTQHQ